MNENIKINGLYALICLIWGSTWLTIRISIDSFPPFLSASLRFLIAFIFIWIWMSFSKSELQKDRTSVYLYFFMGIFSFVIPFGLVYWAEQFIPSGLASVLFGAYPFFVVVLTRLLIPSEKIKLNQTIGMCLGFAGIIIIFSDDFSVQSSNYLYGMFAVLFSSFIQAGIFVSIKKYGQHLNALSMNLIPTAIGALFLFIISFLIEDFSKVKPSKEGIFSVVYLGVFASGVTFTVYYWLLKRINMILLSLVAFITPVVAVFLGWIILGEVLKNNQIIGSGFVLTGVLLANLTFNKTSKGD